jgi:hypothetical protein
MAKTQKISREAVSLLLANIKSNAVDVEQMREFVSELKPNTPRVMRVEAELKLANMQMEAINMRSKLIAVVKMALENMNAIDVVSFAEKHIDEIATCATIRKETIAKNVENKKEVEKREIVSNAFAALALRDADGNIVRDKDGNVILDGEKVGNVGHVAAVK